MPTSTESLYFDVAMKKKNEIRAQNGARMLEKNIIRMEIIKFHCA